MKRIKPLKQVALALACAVLCTSAVAGEAAAALGSCLADKTTGKDRRELARWVYLAMSEHPDMKRLSSIPGDAKEDALKVTGALVTRLLAEDCAAQAREAIKREGPGSFTDAFGVLGRLAMQELMTNADVSAAFSGIGKYADRKKLDAALAER
jgi:hypothetical protein